MALRPAVSRNLSVPSRDEATLPSSPFFLRPHPLPKVITSCMLQHTKAYPRGTSRRLRYSSSGRTIPEFFDDFQFQRHALPSRIVSSFPNLTPGIRPNVSPPPPPPPFPLRQRCPTVSPSHRARIAARRASTTAQLVLFLFWASRIFSLRHGSTGRSPRRKNGTHTHRGEQGARARPRFGHSEIYASCPPPAFPQAG